MNKLTKLNTLVIDNSTHSWGKKPDTIPRLKKFRLKTKFRLTLYIWANIILLILSI